MKFILALLLTVFSSSECYSQQLDENISRIANDLALKVSKKNRIKLALTDFVNTEGKTDALTDYIREELELKLINSDVNLQVIDRKHIKLLLSEHHLQSEGLIDESTAKSAISFIKVDGWIVAEITMLADQVKIKVTVTDVSTSQIYAASASGMISDKAIKDLLDPEIKICSECGGKGVVQFQSTCSSCNGSGKFMCTACNGLGKRDGMTVGSYVSCEKCGGTGKLTCQVCAGSGKIISYKTCPKCNGKVRFQTFNSQGNNITLQICDECNGTGKIKTQTVCGSCGGSGEAPFGPSSNWERRPCKTCSGKGYLVTVNACRKCNGTGKL